MAGVCVYCKEDAICVCYSCRARGPAVRLCATHAETHWDWCQNRHRRLPVPLEGLGGPLLFFPDPAQCAAFVDKGKPLDDGRPRIRQKVVARA